MKRYVGFILAALAAIFLGGCFGSGGSSASPPSNVAVAAKDSRVVVTWDMQPGVQYWIWKAAGTGVTPKTCSSLPQCTTSINVTSPATISGLINGVTYSFSINSRINGGPGGEGSPAVSATPRLAGATWTAGSALGSSNLRGVTYGAMFVAVGDGGASQSSTDGKIWTPLTPATSAGLNAVKYDSAHAKYLSVGTSGAVIALTPATSGTVWSALASPTGNTLYALANNGTGLTVSTGASGTIITTSDGSSWTAATSIPAAASGKALYGVAYGYSTATLGNIFVAVGQSGIVLYSTDGLNWTAATPGTSSYDLKGVTYGAAAAVFVAVGSNGTVLTSPDGITWTPQISTTIPASTLLNSVTFSAGRRFVAVADDGNIFYSEYSSVGTIWTQVTPQVTTTPLYGIATGALFDYSAVGAAGLNLYSD